MDDRSQKPAGHFGLDDADATTQADRRDETRERLGVRLTDVDLRTLLNPPEEVVQTYLQTRARDQLSAAQAVAAAKPVEWLVDGILPRGCLVILAGPAKLAGKSLTALDLALAVARGRPFLDRPTRKGKVLVANLEDGANRIGRRLKQFGVSADEVDLPIRLVRDAEGLWRYLQAMVVDPVDLLIIDPIVELEAWVGIDDENAAGPVAQLLTMLRELAQITNGVILVPHHHRKANDRMRGTTAFEGSSDGWWNVLLQKHDPSIRHIDVTLRDGPPVSLDVRLLIDEHDRISLSVLTDEECVEAEEKEARVTGKACRDAVYAGVCTALQNGAKAGGRERWLSIDRLQDVCKARRADVMDVIEKLVAEGLAMRGTGGRGVSWQGPHTWERAEAGIATRGGKPA